MTPFDELAYSSRLKATSPACKAGLTLFTMVVCLCVARTAFSLGVLVFISAVCIFFSGVPVRRWLRLCAIPFWFLLVGCVLVAVSFSDAPNGSPGVALLGGWLSVTRTGLLEAANLFCKAMACVSCLYFLCVTTPMNHILGLLERLHTPALLVELMLMIYRFIFVLLELAQKMAVAQRARLGNASYRASMRSLAALASTLFVRALQKSTRVYDAMESRGYTGGITYTGALPAASLRQRAVLAAYAVCLTALGLAARLFTGV